MVVLFCSFAQCRGRPMCLPRYMSHPIRADTQVCPYSLRSQILNYEGRNYSAIIHFEEHSEAKTQTKGH